MPSQRKTEASLLVAVSAIAGLLIAEGLLRSFPLFGVVLGPHPRYLHTLVPNSRQLRFDVGNSWRPYMVRINSSGHWGPEEPPAGASPRVMVYGDSFIDSHYGRLGESYPVRLADHLERLRGRPVQVINAGVFGYGPDQECLRIEDDLEQSRPALIVLALFAGNDFGDLIRDKLFRPGPDGSAVATPRIVGPELTGIFQQAGTLHIGRALMSLRWKVGEIRRSKLAPQRDASGGSGTDGDAAPPAARSEEFVLRMLEARQREYQEFVVDGDDVIRNVFGDGYDFDLELFPQQAAALYKKALMACVLGRIEATARAHGVPILFLVIPSPIDVARNWPIVIDRSVYPDYRASAVTDFLQEQAERLGVPCVNLFEPFEAAHGTALYQPSPDEHWNPTGIDLAARLTADRIQSARLLSISSH